MAEGDADAAYSDDEFGSEHEESGGYEEFEEGEDETDAVQNVPSQEDEAAAGGEESYIQDAPSQVTGAVDNDSYEDEDEAEQYDGEFDDEEATVETAHSSTLPTDGGTRELLSDGTVSKPPDDDLIGETTPNNDAPLSQDQSDVAGDRNKEHVDEMAPEEVAASPNTSLVSDINTEESAPRRRASVAASIIVGLTEVSPSQNHYLRSGSLPMILSEIPLNKWMDTIPQELSPERADQYRRQSVPLPVLEEAPPSSSVDGESNAETDDSENDVGDAISTSNHSNSRVRARSYQDLRSDKEVVPIRRAQSLLYTGSLPSVKEIHAAEEIHAVEEPHADDYAVDNANEQENDESYSEDKETSTAEENQDATSKADGQESGESYSEDENYGNDSDGSFQSEYEHDDAQAPENTAENHTTASLEASAGTHRTSNEDGTGSSESAAQEITDDTSNNPSASMCPDNRSIASTRDVKTESQQEEDNEYADEMEDNFDTDTFQLEKIGTPNMSSGEASDFDVEEFVDEGGRETDNLLQEALSLLPRQRDDRNSPSDEETVVPGDVPSKVNETSPQGGDSEGTNTGTKFTTPYDDDDEFLDDDAVFHDQKTPDEYDSKTHNGIDQYEFDEDDDEPQKAVILLQNESTMAVEAANGNKGESVVPQSVEIVAVQSSQLPGSSISAQLSTGEKEVRETPIVPSENPTLANEPSKEVKPPTPQVEALVAPADQQTALVEESVTSIEPAESSQPTDSTSVNTTKGPSTTNQQSKPTPPEQAKPPSRPSRQIRQVKSTAPATQGPSLKPSRPTSTRSIPPSSSTGTQRNIAQRSPRNQSTSQPTSDPRTPHNSSAGSTLLIKDNPHKLAKPNSPRKSPQGKPESPQKVSSPRSPSSSCSGPYQYLPNEYPKLPRKEPVPKQRMSAKHCGEHGAKRRPLQPVRTPANLRFDLPRMDKSKRDWLFVNMFRHGDDLSKYEAFMPPTLFARPPPTSSSKETKKRPLSARQVYGDPQASGFGRKLLQQVNSAMQDRERSWVPTTPHDSKLPPYDSILDKFCTTVTSPVVQRQIYQTRHRDLSPQLAFVLEKRVERHCKKGFHDSFGGVGASYKTEIVPTSPSDGSRPRQMSPRG